MQQRTFERYEKKYLLSAEQYGRLRKKLEDKMSPDRYGKNTVLSVYYDTPDFRLIRMSMEKPIYKEKLRMRSYGVPSADESVFVELKKKYNGVVYKRRVNMPLKTAEKWLADEGKCIPVPSNDMTVAENFLFRQISKEIAHSFEIYPELAPAMFICYDRLAFDGAEDTRLRVTFDDRILFRREELSLAAGAWGEPILEAGQRLMEIKMPGAMPIWLSQILDEFKIYPTSFSKYGTAFERIMIRSRNGGIKNVS